MISSDDTSVISTVEASLIKAGLKCKVMKTQKNFDSFKFARYLNIDEFSAIVAVGSRKTMHEVLNGMMARSDTKTLPIGYISPSKGVSGAIQNIISAKAAKFTLYKALLDVQSEEQIYNESECVHEQRRFMMDSVVVGAA